MMIEQIPPGTTIQHRGTRELWTVGMLDSGEKVLVRVVPAPRPLPADRDAVRPLWQFGAHEFDELPTPLPLSGVTVVMHHQGRD